MPQLNFTKVNLLSFSRKPASGSANFSSIPSKSVLKALEWEELPESYKTGSPMSAILKCSVIELIPGQGDLAKHAVELGVSTIRDFSIQRKQVKKGKKAQKVPQTRLELTFTVDWVDGNGAKMLEAYMSCGASDGTLKASYEKQAEQQDLIVTEELQGALDDVQRKRASGNDIN